MTEKNQCAQRKSFALTEEEKFKGEVRTVVCHNRGDRDSLLFGNLQLDERDRYDGWGVSAAREEELSAAGAWTTYVDDYEGFHRLQRQEELLFTSEAALEGVQYQIRSIEEELGELREDARSMKSQYGSIEPSMVRRGQYLSHRLLFDPSQRQYGEIECPPPDGYCESPYDDGDIAYNFMSDEGTCGIDEEGNPYCVSSYDESLFFFDYCWHDASASPKEYCQVIDGVAQCVEE